MTRMQLVLKSPWFYCKIALSAAMFIKGILLLAQVFGAIDPARRVLLVADLLLLGSGCSGLSRLSVDGKGEFSLPMLWQRAQNSVLSTVFFTALALAGVCHSFSVMESDPLIRFYGALLTIVFGFGWFYHLAKNAPFSGTDEAH